MLGLTAGTLGAGGFTYLYATADIPHRAGTHTMSEIHFVTSDGVNVATVQPPDGEKQGTSPAAISQYMKNAIVASEDGGFWEHSGINPKRIAAATVQHALGRSGGGASTITQQLVKNTIVGDEHSLDRKVREAAYALKVTNTKTKDEVLSDYLSIVYFGRGAYGVEDAARKFFGVSALDLNPAQSALLAGMVQSPSALDPDVNPEGARERFNYVVDRMKHDGYIPQGAQVEFPELVSPPPPKVTVGVDGDYGHAVSMAFAELESMGIDRTTLHNVGATVTLTVNDAKQRAVQNIVRSHIGGDLRAAVVSVDSANGGVVAMYSGEDGLGFNYATAGQMTGSTAKVFALTAAMERGIPASKTYSSAPYNEGGVSVTNSSVASCTACSITQSTVESLNTSYLRIQNDIGGATETQNMAWRLGVPREINGEASLGGDQPYDGIVLGQYLTAPIDMANAYGTIASGGKRHQAHIVAGVNTMKKSTLYEFHGKEDPVISEQTAAQVSNVLSGVADYSNHNQLAGGGGKMKTGTVQLGSTGENRDAWTVGFVDGGLSTAVWVGSDNGVPLYYGGGKMWGATLPATMWRQTMNAIR